MAANGVWKRSSHADFGSQKQQEYHFPRFHRGQKDLKADDLKQNCAAAYASTCQACIRCTAALRIGAPENGVIRNYATNLSGLEGRSAIMARVKILSRIPSQVTIAYSQTET